MCPYCQSHSIHRARRLGLERALSYFGIVPYRCEMCLARFLALKNAMYPARASYTGY